MFVSDTAPARNAKAQPADRINAARLDVARWFNERVNRAKRAGRFMETATLSPYLADHLIACHMPKGSNRHLRERTVERLAAAISAGHWDGNTHQGISFAPDGTVNDGQHRIHAVARSRIAVDLPMTFGQPRETFAVIDQDFTPRSAADLVQLYGLDVGTPSIGSAIAWLVVALERPGATGKYVPNNRQDVIGFVLKHEKEVHAAVLRGQKVSRGVRSRLSPSNIGAAVYLIAAAGAPPALLDTFVEQLASGAGLNAGDPVLVLREGLREGIFTANDHTARTRRMREAAAVILAWNAKRAKRSLRSNKPLMMGDEFPKVTP